MSLRNNKLLNLKSQDRGATPSVLFVCTGNICRSPYMELYFKRQLQELGITDIGVSSAGTSHVPRHRIAGPMAEILAAQGIESNKFYSQGLTSTSIDQAALILTADVSHRSAVVRLVPSAHARVFTLLQSARLLRHYPAADSLRDGLPALVSITRSMASSRGLAGPSGGDADNIPDPWQLSPTDYKYAVSLMSGPLQRLAIEIWASNGMS